MRRHAARVATASIAVVGGLVVLWLSFRVFRYHSLNHDEAVYLQQAAMLLDGQLALYPPVEGVFRPWFFVEDGDRLYPKYAPVPAAMFAVGRLLGEYRLALFGIAAGNLALVIGVVSRVFDRRTGLLAAVFVLCSPLFLLDSAVFLPYAPTTLLNLAFAYAYLRADAEGGRRWPTIAGAAIGLAFFARPYTAVLFAAPFIGHALWTLRRNWRGALPRQATTAIVGLLGVTGTLLYNAHMTGSPLVFPYQAFAPLDGLGFGEREILAHSVRYTPELALRANARVVMALFTEWIAGGFLGATLAGVGAAVTIGQGVSAREATLGGIAVTVIVGNVYFWGNFNILGDLEVAGDGLIAVLGPYYHFDVLVPTAAFAASGALAMAEWVKRVVRSRLAPRPARAVVAVVLLLGLSTLGGATAVAFDGHLEENLEATRTYQTAYEPFEPGPPDDSLILLPDPYGDWLNHPFQPLRNDPGFDGRAVYAIDDRPFAVVDAFPDRRVYRYVYRGPWAPFAGSPEAARLQRVRDVAGARVDLDTSLGIPEGAVGVTVRVRTDEGAEYYVARAVEETLSFSVRLSPDRLGVSGDVRPVETDPIDLDGRETVRIAVFVDYGAGGGFTYRFDLPVVASEDRVRALTPRIERCRDPDLCGGAAAHVPSEAPEGVSVAVNLSAAEPNA